jgi:hypothetical protein
MREGEETGVTASIVVHGNTKEKAKQTILNPERKREWVVWTMLGQRQGIIHCNSTTDFLFCSQIV